MGGTIYWQLRGNAAANKHASIISFFPLTSFMAFWKTVFPTEGNSVAEFVFSEAS